MKESILELTIEEIVERDLLDLGSSIFNSQITLNGLNEVLMWSTVISKIVPVQIQAISGISAMNRGDSMISAFRVRSAASGRGQSRTKQLGSPSRGNWTDYKSNGKSQIIGRISPWQNLAIFDTRLNNSELYSIDVTQSVSTGCRTDTKCRHH